MNDVAHVEIRRTGSRDLVRLGLGVAALGVGAVLGVVWEESGQEVTGLIVAAAAAALYGVAAVASVFLATVDRSVRIALTGEGMYLYGRRRPIRWADVRGVRLLTTKSKLGLLYPVLNVLVCRDGALKTVYVNLGELELSPDRITELVRERVRPVLAGHQPPPSPTDPSAGTTPTAALPAGPLPTA